MEVLQAVLALAEGGSTGNFREEAVFLTVVVGAGGLGGLGLLLGVWSV